ncbi:hypothetical protein BYT27DRAFT_7221273 [Phlegmacium glaucopus]|nr:hypothetical protein BYT27DRAFT_7221273 [Phlegmacium glaucopus]
MSSSATSTTTDTNSLTPSRVEKHSLTPGDSPLPKKQKSSIDQPNWDIDSNPSPQDKIPNEPNIEDNYHGRRASLPMLPSESHVRYAPYPPPILRQNYAPSNQSSLSSYTFPSNIDEPAERTSGRPKASTDLNNFGVTNSYDSPYPNSGLSNSTTCLSTFSSSHFNSPMNSDIRTPGISPYSKSDTWNGSPPGIVRPNSTLGQQPSSQADDGLHHTSFSAPMSQAHMYAGSAQISGQHDRKSLSGIKSELSFLSSDFLPLGNPQYSPSLGPAAPNIAASSPSRSPQSMPPSTLVDRPQRKRGKLPKETTDYLKAWLHRHSDHPYASEEEKKQLCHATGLSMSQVSNWMINARRRILAPAHRVASGPTKTALFPTPVGRSASLSASLDPNTLHPMPNSPDNHHYSSYYGGEPSRRMLGHPSSQSSHHLSGGLYAPDQGTHSPSHTPSSYMHSDVPLPAPPSLSNNPFSSYNPYSSSERNMYPSRLPSPRSTAQPQYFNEGNSHSGSGSGSGSGHETPQ